MPPRIMSNRTVWASALFSFATGAAFLSSVYFLPIWFQAVKGASAVNSGLMNLPLLIACVVMSLIAGAAVTIYGYYTPFMIAGTVFMAIGYGLLSTFTPDTDHPMWIGYQVIAGAGVGMAMQQRSWPCRPCSTSRTWPIGTSAVVFLQTLGGALFVSVSQNVFTTSSPPTSKSLSPGLDPRVVLATGATSIQSTIPPDMLAGVTLAYSDALTKTFLVSASLAAVTIFGAVFVEWKSVKGKKVEVGMA